MTTTERGRILVLDAGDALVTVKGLIVEGTDPDSMRRAQHLLERVATLAKDRAQDLARTRERLTK